MAYKTVQRVFVPNLKSSGPMKTELWAKKLENFVLCCMGKWAGVHSFANEHDCHNITVYGDLLKFEQPYFLHLLVYRSEPCRELS